MPPQTGPPRSRSRNPRGVLPLDSRNYELLEKSDNRLAFATTFPNGLRVTKEYIPEPGKYELGVKITLKNTGNQPLDAQYAIVAAGRLVPEAGLSTEVYGAIGRRTSPENVDIDREFPGSVRKQPVLAVNNPREPLIWAGAGNRYFAAILRPKPKTDSTFGFIASASVELLPQCDELVSTTGRAVLADNVVVKLLTEKRSLKPGEEVSDEYTYFLGPKDQDVLAQYPDIAGPAELRLVRLRQQDSAGAPARPLPRDPELRRRDHPDDDHGPALRLPHDAQGADRHVPHAETPAADQGDAGEVQGRPAAAGPRDDGTLPQAQREPDERLLADARPIAHPLGPLPDAHVRPLTCASSRSCSGSATSRNPTRSPPSAASR